MFRLFFIVLFVMFCTQLGAMSTKNELTPYKKISDNRIYEDDDIIPLIQSFATTPNEGFQLRKTLKKMFYDTDNSNISVERAFIFGLMDLKLHAGKNKIFKEISNIINTAAYWTCVRKTALSKHPNSYNTYLDELYNKLNKSNKIEQKNILQKELAKAKKHKEYSNWYFEAKRANIERIICLLSIYEKEEMKK